MQISTILKYLLIGLFLLSIQTGYGQEIFQANSGKYGYKKENKIIVKPIYIQAFPFQQGIGKVSNGKSIFLITEKGKPWLKKFTPQDMGWSQPANQYVIEDKTGAKVNNLWGLINEDKEWVIPAQYDGIWKISDHLVAVKKGDKTGVFNSQGQQIIPCEYQEILFQFNGFFVQKPKHNHWIFIDINGVPKTKPMIDLWSQIDDQWVLLEGKHHYGLLTTNGKLELPVQFKNISFKAGKPQVESYTAWEWIDQEGHFKDSLFFDHLTTLPNDWHMVEYGKEKAIYSPEWEYYCSECWDSISFLPNQNSIWWKDNQGALKDANFKHLFPKPFRAIQQLNDSIFLITENQGYFNLFNINSPKEIIAIGDRFKASNSYFSFYSGRLRNWHYFHRQTLNKAFTFNEYKTFKGNYAAHQDPETGSWGVIDTEQHWVISPYFDSTFVAHDSLFCIWDQGVWSTVSPEGLERYRSSPKEQIKAVTNGFIEISIENKIGLLKPQGFKWITPRYDSITIADNPRWIWAYQQGQQLWIDTEDLLIPNINDFKKVKTTGNLTEARIPFQMNNRYGFVDNLGRIRISPRYENVKNFADGLAPFKLGNRWGYINHFDKIVIQPYYDDACSHKNGYAVVMTDDKYGIIDLNNNLLLEQSYDQIKQNEYGNWILLKDGYFGLMEKNFQSFIYTKYEQITDLGTGFIISQKNGLKGIEQYNGLVVKLPLYEKILKGGNNTFFISNKKD